MTELKHKQLYKMLELPGEVVELLDTYAKQRIQDIPEAICRKLCVREEWDTGVKELQSILGDDPDGMKILWEQLNMLCQYTYGEYVKRGIGDDIFIATMKFCTRFLYEHFNTWGAYKYVWAWWFPRQIMVQEFRIGALEYEFIDGEEREVAVHIPSDADISMDSIQASLSAFHRFRAIYYPEWKNVRLTCDTWMLMPQLADFLGESSRIAGFQKLFEVEHINREETWYMGWIFPGYDAIDERLPEKTLLQRELKKYLLAGNKFGIARGHLKA